MQRKEQQVQGKKTQQTEATELHMFTHNGDAHYLITEDKSLIGNPIINSLGVTLKDYPKGIHTFEPRQGVYSR
jgi:hypothetical protein